MENGLIIQNTPRTVRVCYKSSPCNCLHVQNRVKPAIDRQTDRRTVGRLKSLWIRSPTNSCEALQILAIDTSLPWRSLRHYIATVKYLRTVPLSLASSVAMHADFHIFFSVIHSEILNTYYLQYPHFINYYILHTTSLCEIYRVIHNEVITFGHSSFFFTVCYLTTPY